MSTKRNNKFKVGNKESNREEEHMKMEILEI
jgi:hypothetical protein